MNDKERKQAEEKPWLEVPLEISPAKLPQLGKAKGPLAIFLGAALFFIALGVAPQLSSGPVPQNGTVAEPSELPSAISSSSESRTEDEGANGASTSSQVTVSEKDNEETATTTATDNAATTIELPDLAGLTLTEAERVIKSLGLLQWRSVEQTAEGTVGRVIRTNPVPGSTISLGEFNSTRTLEVFVSKGESKQFVMPDLAGMTKTKALEFIRSQGITRWRSSDKPSSVAKYLVAGSSPAAGANVDVETYNTEKWLEIYISTGENAPISNATLVAYNPTISWSTIDDYLNGQSKGNWGFSSMVISQGVLKVSVNANFPKDTTILLGNSCRFIVEGSFGLGCPNSMPSEVFAKAGSWTPEFQLEAYIHLGGYSEPKLFEVELALKDDTGIREEKLVFRISGWE
jgi:hypothetical protein